MNTEDRLEETLDNLWDIASQLYPYYNYTDTVSQNEISKAKTAILELFKEKDKEILKTREASWEIQRQNRELQAEIKEKDKRIEELEKEVNTERTGRHKKDVAYVLLDGKYDSILKKIKELQAEIKRLRECVPEKKLCDSVPAPTYGDGWNACIDEIKKRMG